MKTAAGSTAEEGSMLKTSYPVLAKQQYRIWAG